jgi:hypothetical protein
MGLNVSGYIPIHDVLCVKIFCLFRTRRFVTGLQGASWALLSPPAFQCLLVQIYTQAYKCMSRYWSFQDHAAHYTTSMSF